jgi:glycosyltransferase involved in cell wall biosynthesis
MKVALIHDVLRAYSNAERILQVLHRIYPDAPVYTAFVDRQRLGEDMRRFADWDIRTTFASRLPGIKRNFRAYQMGLAYIWESLDLAGYDLVISSSGDYGSQAVLTRSQTLHVSYCHTPPRFLWEPTPSMTHHWSKTWIDPHLRQYDFYAAQRVDRFVTSSEGVARRIQKFYRRAAEVIPPPVRIRGEGKAGDQYYLYVGQLHPDQDVDLAIAACRKLQRPLWIVSTGRPAQRLKPPVGSDVRFLVGVSDEQLIELYAGAIALICPSAFEDFNFAAVEAMGCGVPVIGCQQSGLSEVILNYRTGLLFAQPTLENLCEAITQFEKLRFSEQACIERAEEFAEFAFVSKFKWFVTKAMDDHNGQKDDGDGGMRG